MRLRPAILPVLLAAGATCASAQELGQGGFKLVLGSFSGAEKAGLGQDKNYGLAVFGSYFLSTKGSIEFEGGFRYTPRAEETVNNFVYSRKMSTYYLGATYRQKVWFDGFFVQGGLRASRSEVSEDVTDPTGVVSPVNRTGPQTTAVRPTLGVGYTFDQRYSVTFGGASMKAANAAGTPKSGTQLELSLLIRL